jgi:AbrB family looped-hinge helix DNA binding protein
MNTSVMPRRSAMSATLAIKGQVTIPKEIRDVLDLAPGCAVDFAVNRDGEVVIHKLGACLQIINPIIYSELSLTFSTLEALDRALHDIGVAMIETPHPALFLANRSSASQRRQRRPLSQLATRQAERCDRSGGPGGGVAKASGPSIAARHVDAGWQFAGFAIAANVGRHNLRRRFVVGRRRTVRQDRHPGMSPRPSIGR